MVFFFWTDKLSFCSWFFYESQTSSFLGKCVDGSLNFVYIYNLFSGSMVSRFKLLSVLTIHT